MSWGSKKIFKIFLLIALVFSFSLAPVSVGNMELSVVSAAPGDDEQPDTLTNESVRAIGRFFGSAADKVSSSVASIGNLYDLLTGFAGNCSPFSAEGWMNCMVSVSYASFTILSFFLYLAGTLFDVVLNILVFDIKDTLDKISVIDEIWAVFRDLANILFIFLLLYASIRIIIDAGASKVGSLISKVIVIAVLINFSLFITKAIIDSSNILALQFKEAITTDEGGGSVSVGENLMGSFGLQTILAKDVEGNFGGTYSNAFASFNQKSLNQKIPILVGGSVMTLVAIFVLLLASFMLLFRFMMLIILMILSPLAFVADILPQTRSYSGKWWSMLIKESFYAPIFLMFLWVTLKIINSDGFALALFGEENGSSNFSLLLQTLSEGSLDPATKEIRRAFGSIISFALVIGFLLSSVLIGKFLGNRFSGTAMSWAKNVRSFATKPARLAAGVANREIVGGALERVRKSSKMGNLVTSKGLVGVAGRYAEDKLNSNKLAKGYRSKISNDSKQINRVIKETEEKTRAEKDRLRESNSYDEQKIQESKDAREASVAPMQARISSLEDEEKKKEKEKTELEEAKNEMKRLAEVKAGSTSGSLTEAEERLEQETKMKISSLEKSLNERKISDIRSEMDTQKKMLAARENSQDYKGRLRYEERYQNDIDARKPKIKDLDTKEEENKRNLESRAADAFDSSFFRSGAETAAKIRESSKKRRKADKNKVKRDANKEDAEEIIKGLEELKKMHEKEKKDLEEREAKAASMTDEEKAKFAKEKIENQQNIINTKKEISKLAAILYKDDEKKGGDDGGDKKEDKDK